MFKLVRRILLAVALVFPAAGIQAGDAPLDLTWEMLIPADAGATQAPTTRFGRVQHGELTANPEDDSRLYRMAENLDGKQVSLPGFIVPLDLSAGTIKEFLLVPYVGACIHVPPPPPNQIVYVRSAKGIPIRGLFDAIVVTGRMTVAGKKTELADIGYQMDAESVSTYKR